MSFVFVVFLGPVLPASACCVVVAVADHLNDEQGPGSSPGALFVRTFVRRAACQASEGFPRRREETTAMVPTVRTPRPAAPHRAVEDSRPVLASPCADTAACVVTWPVTVTWAVAVAPEPAPTAVSVHTPGVSMTAVYVKAPCPSAITTAELVVAAPWPGVQVIVMVTDSPGVMPEPVNVGEPPGLTVPVSTPPREGAAGYSRAAAAVAPESASAPARAAVARMRFMKFPNVEMNERPKVFSLDC